MNKFTLWQGRDKPLTETERAASFVSSSLSFLSHSGLAERGKAIKWPRGTEWEAGEKPLDKHMCLPGNLAHCCWKAIFLNISICPTLLQLFSHARCPVAWTPLPFLEAANFPSGVNTLLTRYDIRDQEIPRAGDIVSEHSPLACFHWEHYVHNRIIYCQHPNSGGR